MSQVTLRDIALKVGKSVATVSRALHGYPDISPATREAVQRAAQELGYTPHRIAQQLRKRRTNTLGLIIPTFGPRFSDPFLSEFLAGVGNQASAAGYDLLVATRPAGPKELDVYRNYAQGRRVDGFLVLRVRRRDPRIAYLRQRGVPFVAFGRTAGKNDFPFVDVDGATGMDQVVTYLSQRGHRHLGFIAPPLEYTFAWERWQGFRRALAEHRLPWRDDWFAEGGMTEQGGYTAARQLLSQSTPPTALVAGNDLMALGALRAAQEVGLRPGYDIAITGFDDIPLAQHTIPPLTTVHQPIYQIGQQVCRMLITLLAGQEPEPFQVTLTPRLVIRASA